MAISQFPAANGLARRVDLFTASGTWTAPAGVTYAVAYIRAGGGGGGGRGGTTGSAGGSSSAFGTTCNGGNGGVPFTNQTSNTVDGTNAPANSGAGGGGAGSVDTGTTGGRHGTAEKGHDGCQLVVGSVVTPGTGYTITIGSGGAGGTGTGPGGNGGSGAVWIEYEVAV